MTNSSRRERILNKFRKDARGSFATVYRALTQISAERNSDTLDEKEVRERIREIAKTDRELVRSY